MVKQNGVERLWTDIGDSRVMLGGAGDNERQWEAG